MLAYSYNEFEIKKNYYTDSYYMIYKDSVPFSPLCCRTLAVAKKVLDLVYPNNKNSIMSPILKPTEVIENNFVSTKCECGCGTTFIKDIRGKKKFISGHNNTNYYRKASKLWN